MRNSDPPPQALVEFERKLSHYFTKPLRRDDIDHICKEVEKFWEAPEARQAVYARAGIWKFWTDEFYRSLTPIDQVWTDPSATFLFPRDGGPADLIVTTQDRAEELVQITYVCDGQKRRLQYELLASQGHATGSGKIFRDPKTKQPVEIPGTRRKDISIAELARDVAASIDAKCRKEYPPGTTLVCSIEERDTFAPTWKLDDYAPLIEAAKSASVGGNFEKIYLTGTRDWGFAKRIDR